MSFLYASLAWDGLVCDILLTLTGGAATGMRLTAVIQGCAHDRYF